MANLQIPLQIFRNRNSQSHGEAIAYYLCDDPDGPNLSQHEAADKLGTTRDQLWTQLRRAREKLS